MEKNANILRLTLVLLLRCFMKSLRLVFMPIGLDQLAMGIGLGGKSMCDDDDKTGGDNDAFYDKVTIDW